MYIINNWPFSAYTNINYFTTIFPIFCIEINFVFTNFISYKHAYAEQKADRLFVSEVLYIYKMIQFRLSN